MSGSPSARFRPRDLVDVVVVGSGAAGGIVAKELATAGLTVVVLEQGPRLERQQFEHDEFKYFFRNGIVNDPERQPQTFAPTPDQQAKRGAGRLMYARLVGGGSVHFTANYWRFHEIDFVEASRHGSISGTGFADWPITYADLEPYYTKAEWELGVSGVPGPFDAPRSRAYPLPPMPVKASGVLFEEASRRLGLHPQPVPLAILSEPFGGRMACHHCGFCLGFGCEFGAKSATLYTVIPVAEATGRCEIRPQSYVRRIEIDERTGRATGVIYFDEQKIEQRQRTRSVVVCANGAETPRLLLMSRSNRFPDGLANSSGLVGKYLMFNGYCTAGGTFERLLNEWKSVTASRMIHDFYDADPARGFYGGGGIDARFAGYPMGFALGGVIGTLGPDMPTWGADYKRLLRESYSRTMYAACHTTSLPLAANAVSLDPTLKDDWGQPALRFTYQDHPDDLATMRFLQAKALAILEAAGARRAWADPVNPSTFAVHLLGTCRMGDDPRTSVVDRYNRTHDVRNLFLCDGSSFVTSGRGQPTCTIQALAYRAGEHIAQFARRGEI
ncbi:MAG TPA: GMC family oxidoreductase [Gemmatimonadales bacterium]|nr:GMC family oxidoreductase [Gemmatimonadales bacterium]